MNAKQSGPLVEFMALGNINQVDLSRLVGVAQCTMSQILSGARKASPEVLLELHRVTRVPISELAKSYGRQAVQDLVSAC